MGTWSRLAGLAFLDWLAPAAGQRWLDVGCGGGAFTELIFERCAPATVHGIDPSEAQLAHARARLSARHAEFRQGDAMAQPFPDDAFDVAVMPLVITFVPDPARGVAEMARVVRSGGTLAAYVWDMQGGGFPYDALLVELRRLGHAFAEPPSPGASELSAMKDLWDGARIRAVETGEIEVRRTFEDFDDFWTTILGSPSAGPTLAAMAPGEIVDLRKSLRERLPTGAAGRIAVRARAHAVKGRVP